MKCPHCGSENPIHQVFCSACGRKIGASFDAIAESVEGDSQVDKVGVAARVLLPITVITGLVGVGFLVVSPRFGRPPRAERSPSVCPPPPAIPIAPVTEAALPSLPGLRSGGEPPGATEAEFLPLPALGGQMVMKLGFRRSPLNRAIHAGRGGSPEALKAIARGLSCLRSRQAPDGSWQVAGNWEKGRLTWGKVGVTSLAVLALLGDGHVWTEPRNLLGRSAGSGVRFLVEEQGASGLVGKAAGNYMYNHGMATAALSEAYAMSGLPELRERARRAVEFLLAAQQKSGGWDYTERKGRRSDISVTAWQIAALRSARLAGVPSPELDKELEKALAAAANYVDSLTSPTTWETGYEARPGPKGKIEHPTLGPTAMALACREAIAASARPGGELLASAALRPSILANQARVLLMPQNAPRWNPKWAGGGARSENHMFYYWYHGTMGMRAAEAEQWAAWNGAVTRTLLAGQQQDGSWPNAGRWAWDGGRVYVTALAILTLQATYRYP